jgi:hypothetical protein
LGLVIAFDTSQYLENYQFNKVISHFTEQFWQGLYEEHPIISAYGIWHWSILGLILVVFEKISLSKKHLWCDFPFIGA